MKKPPLQKILYLLSGILLMVMIPVQWNLSTQKKEIDTLSEKLLQIHKATSENTHETHLIQRQLADQKENVTRSLVSHADPLPWCIDWMRSHAGLHSDVEMECIGLKTPSAMKINRPARAAMEGTLAYLAPYAIRLNLNEISLTKLQYILEQIESSRLSGLVQHLSVKPSKQKGLYSVVAIIYLPMLPHPDTRKVLIQFFDTTNLSKIAVMSREPPV